MTIIITIHGAGQLNVKLVQVNLTRLVRTTTTWRVALGHAWAFAAKGDATLRRARIAPHALQAGDWEAHLTTPMLH